MIPLILRLKKSTHKEIAAAQDLIVSALYEVFDDAVLHGGTAIWRCYKGNRFSEDVDAYLPRDTAKVSSFFDNLVKKGFSIEKRKISQNSVFSTLRFGRTVVRFEAVFKKVKGSLREYETVEGNLITVYTLEPEELIAEKVNAYLGRLKIRDIYDVFFLLRHVKEEEKAIPSIRRLLSNFKNPVDESDLKVLILEGLVPSLEDISGYIKRWG